jgi:hypothetical protein
MRPYSIYAAITVRVEKPSGKMPKIPGHNRALPRLQVDRAQVLSALPVLREEAWPVPRAADYLHASYFLLGADLVVGPDCAHGSLALASDAGHLRVLAPVTQRRPIDSGCHADAAQTESAFHKSDRMAAHVGAVHNQSVAGGTDKPGLDTWRILLVPRVGFEPTLHGF